MKYTKDERLAIGRRIYEGELSRFEAASEYGIGPDTARQYMRLYRDEYHLPAKHSSSGSARQKALSHTPTVRKSYDRMTREELIQELIRARITEPLLNKDVH